jgi:hypothetical protein
MWHMDMRESSQCADCGRDLLAKDELVPRLVTAIQFVRRVMGRQVFICWRCADERYKARQVKACQNHTDRQGDFWVGARLL